MPWIDEDATNASAQTNIQYASDLRTFADQQAAHEIEQIGMLGDLYLDLKDAYTQHLIPARRDAHYRLAALHDGHGQSNFNTVNLFTQEDEGRAARMGQITGEGDATPPSQMV